MRRRSMHENREIPSTLAVEGAAGRSEKASGRASGAYVGGKSDSPIVPMKPPNKGDGDIAGGGGGGKGVDQGEHVIVAHVPDTAPDRRDERPIACARGVLSHVYAKYPR